MSNKLKNETVYRIDHIPGEEIDLDQEFENIHTHREYDAHGNLLMEITYTRDGSVADKILMDYDEKGNLTETRIFDEYGDILERKEVFYFPDNRIQKEMTYYLDGSYDLNEYFYDDNGRLTGMKVKDDEDEPDYSERYYYDGEDVVKLERYDDEDELIFSQEDKYEEGKLVSRTTWSDEDDEPYTLVQNYSVHGHMVEELRYNSDNELVERNIYEEDENGRVFRLTEENRQRKNTTDFEYDDKGRVAYQKETDLHGDLNHELWRFFGPDGELVRTTVEMVMKPSLEKRAYSLIHKREYYS